MSSISHSDTRGPAIDSEKISSRHHVAPGFESDAALVSSATNSSLARLARATFRLRRTGSREIGRCPTHACTKLWGIELDALRSVLVRCRWLLSGESRSVAPSRGAISVDDGRRYSSFHPARGCGPDCTGHRHGQVLARDRLCKDVGRRSRSHQPLERISNSRDMARPLTELAEWSLHHPRTGSIAAQDQQESTCDVKDPSDRC